MILIQKKGEDIMSVEKAQEFFEKVWADDSLSSQLTGLENEQESVDKAVSLGKEQGFDFTAEEIQEVVAAQQSQQRELPSQHLIEFPAPDAARCPLHLLAFPRGRIPRNGGPAFFFCMGVKSA